MKNSNALKKKVTTILWSFCSVVYLLLTISHFQMRQQLQPIKIEFAKEASSEYGDALRIVRKRNAFLAKHGYIIIGKWHTNSFFHFNCIYFYCPLMSKAKIYPTPYNKTGYNRNDPPDNY